MSGFPADGMPKHNQYCREDWTMYGGAGPRGMGPNGDGCICMLDPGPFWEAAPGFTFEPEPWKQQEGSNILLPPNVTVEFALDMSEPSVIVTDPRLWDSAPNSVTHVAGAQVSMFGRYLRQRCDWCGIVLIEYDLERVAVPVDQPGPPAMWPVGSLVRVDAHISAEVETECDADGVRLPMDSCAFDPATQVQ